MIQYYAHSKMVILMLASLFGGILLCKAQPNNNNNIPQANNEEYSQMSVQAYNAIQDISRLLLLSVRGTPANLSFQDLILMANTFEDTYQQQQDIAGNGENQNHRLQIAKTEILPNEIIGYGSSPRFIPAIINFSFLIQFDLVCRGCEATGYNLFQSQESSLLSTTITRDAYEVPFPSLQMFIEPFVPDYQAFVSSYSQAVMGMNISGVDMVNDIDALRIGTDECDHDGEQEQEASTMFKSQLTIAFYGDTDIPDFNDQLAHVEKIFISTYNDLNVLNPESCDPYSRILSNATAVLHDPFVSDTSRERVRARKGRRLSRRIGYDWKFLNIYFGGSCYGCPSDACLTNDVSGYATCSSNGSRRRHLSEKQNENLGSCYCTENGITNNGPIIPTNEIFLWELEKQFAILRNQTNFTLIESILYLIEVEVPDSCCGYPVNGNLPVEVDGVDFRAAVTSYINDGTSIYGYPINCWDVSSATDMTSAFESQTDFNEPLSCWGTSKVMNMQSMFNQTSNFDGDLSSWNTSKVQTMASMFLEASNFDGDISSWDTSRVTTMYQMFDGASLFNSNISSWCTSKVTTMVRMFFEASIFNSDISTWDTGKVTTMSQMFAYASNFNVNLTEWNTNSTTDMYRVFYGASSFNGDVSAWDTSRVTTMAYMFDGAPNFNTDLSAWDTSSATTMYQMFFQVSSFNSDLSAWDTSKVTDMRRMFYQASSFNIDISVWDISKVTTMTSMFNGASQFQQNLCPWRFNDSNVVLLSDIFLNSNCPNTTDPLPGIGPWCFTC